MRVSNKQLFWAIIAIQAILTLVGFNGFFSDPINHSFQPYWDGQHSNFTYISHLYQPKEEGFWLNKQQNYPYGDYIFYQDNPLTFTVPIKWVSDNIIDLKPYKFAPFNFFHAISVLLCTIFLFLVLKRFVKNQWLLVVGSICLAWINPQILRLQVGHYSLAYSWVMVGGVYFLIKLYEEKQNTLKWHLILTAWVLISSYCHFYYLALLAALILPTQMVMDWLSLDRKLSINNIKTWAIKTGKMAGVFAISYLFLFLSFKLFDGYNHLRDSSANSFDLASWKLNFSYIFSAYNFITYGWFFKNNNLPFYESYAYLGGFALFFMTLLLLLKIFAPKLLLPKNEVIDVTYHHLWLGLMVAGVISFFISLGENYQIYGDAYTFTNYLNPFPYFTDISDMFTQFRCLGRFIWVWWWPLSIFLVILADSYVSKTHHLWLKILVLGISTFLVLDTNSFISMYNEHRDKDNIFGKEVSENCRRRLSPYNPSQFQAILPLPYYHVGISDYDYTIDADKEMYAEMNALSMNNRLPLMGMQNARSVRSHNKALFSIFTDKEVSPELLGKMNDKPVLAILRKASINGEDMGVSEYFPGPDRQPAYYVSTYGHRIVREYPMEKLGEDDRYIYFKWNIKRDYRKLRPMNFSPEAIEATISRIKATPEWLAQIKAKAKERGISEDSMLVLDAEYVLRGN